MSYVTKLGAYGLGAVTAFAVALALLVSVSSTPTAEAATVELAEAEPSIGNVAPGDTVGITVKGALAQVRITGTAAGVGASFVANGGQTINCGDNASCDTDDSDRSTAGRQNVADQVRVALKVDNDAGEGYILVTVVGVGASDNTAQVTKVINVNRSTQVGSLKLTATQKTISAANGTSMLVVNVQNASGTPRGLNGQNVSLVTTLGTLTCPGVTGEVQACSVTTANSSGVPKVANGTPGYQTVTLNGKGVEGTATVTARLGSRTATAQVTLFGTAKNLTAEPMQGSVEIGGNVYVVLTVTDGAGNAVSGQVITPLSNKEVVGPTGSDDDNLVVTERDTAATASSAAGVGYSKDFIHATDSTKSIPACGDDNTGSSDGTADDAFGPGTNAAGKCVVHVTAPDPAGTRNDATRGAHTLNFQISSSVKASAVIEVAGKPASITTNAPAQVDTGSVTTITVSVWDDEDILVGITSVKVRKVDGGGLIEDEGAGGSEMTSNGQSRFTFIAPSSQGSSEILITAGAVNHRVTLQIGEAPEMVAPETSVSGEYGLVIIKNAGSIGDILGELMCGSTTGTTVTLPGNNIYAVGAPSVVNAGFNANVSFPIAEAPAYVSCGG